MSTKAETEKSEVANTLLLVLSAILLATGVAGYYYFQDAVNTPIRVVSLLVIVLLAALVAARSASGATFFRFIKESDIERRKVVWPTHQETLQTSLMVIIVTIIISLFLAAVDWMLGALVRSLVGGA